MSTFILASPREADELIARLFQNGRNARLSAREDMAFKDNEWFDFGQIVLFPLTEAAEDVTLAVKRGQYEWKLPDADVAKAALEKILVGPTPNTSPADKARREGKLRRSLDGMAGIAARLGLFHPRFDSHSLALMPYQRPASIVADTSGIAQGGLDFVARFLSPIARTKVPAIAQMEIINFSHRFLSNSRSGDVKGLDLLIDHLLSQGAQRALLRLEFHSDIEIERTFLLGDPLRSAFTRDDDKDIKSLNLSTDVPSYADRMIVEAARHHQMQGGPGHQVHLLTSDHGLAKMALLEGVSPLYFRAIDNSQLFGRRLTGANLHPFGGRLQYTTLSLLLWECAAAFGRARLETLDGAQSLEVAAFGKDFTWSPYQSRGDLLWVDGNKVAPRSDSPLASSGLAQRFDPALQDLQRVEQQQDSRPLPDFNVMPGVKTKDKTAVAANVAGSANNEASNAIAVNGWYTFKVQLIFDLIGKLDDQQELTDTEVLSVIGTKAKSGSEEYRRFLRSGGLIPAKSWVSTPEVKKLAIALRQKDITTARSVFQLVPSVARFLESLDETGVGRPWDRSLINRGVQAYMTLGEVLLAGADIPGAGYFSTPAHPSLSEFASYAMAAFKLLDKGDGLISTGSWLEAMITQHGIHPEVSRELLKESSSIGLLRRSTEGSTTDIRHDDHKISILRLKEGHPVVEYVYLYRGDYLIPGKSSSSLNIGAP